MTSQERIAPMGTDVITPGRARRPGTDLPESRRPARAVPDARRPVRPVRRRRPDRPVHPAGPVRPASPAGPSGPGRPGRTLRTGPARQEHSPTRLGQIRLSGPRPGSRVRGGELAAVRPAGRTAFVVLVLGLLAGGLICLLVINTTLAANSIQISRLQQVNQARTVRVQQLQQLVTTGQSASVIEQKARSLGMRPQSQLTFLDLRTHSIRVGKGPAR